MSDGISLEEIKEKCQLAYPDQPVGTIWVFHDEEKEKIRRVVTLPQDPVSEDLQKEIEKMKKHLIDFFYSCGGDIETFKKECFKMFESFYHSQKEWFDSSESFQDSRGFIPVKCYIGNIMSCIFENLAPYFPLTHQVVTGYNVFIKEGDKIQYFPLVDVEYTEDYQSVFLSLEEKMKELKHTLSGKDQGVKYLIFETHDHSPIIMFCNGQVMKETKEAFKESISTQQIPSHHSALLGAALSCCVKENTHTINLADFKYEDNKPTKYMVHFLPALLWCVLEQHLPEVPDYLKESNVVRCRPQSHGEGFEFTFTVF